MTLYSHNGATPAPLPHRIRIPQGGGFRTRTDASSFTAAELTAAGYAGPYTPPSYDPVRETRTWDGGNLEYVVSTRPVAERQSEMKAAATAKFRAIVAAGKVIGGVTVDLTSEGFERLGQAHAALVAGSGAINALTVRGKPIDLPDAATAAGVIGAARSHYLAAAKTERDLYDAVDDAADHAALDLIDVDAGTVDGAGGWPS